ncbi:proteinase inhibitor I2, Kunitz [Oceanospirillum sp. MED92]|uniref:Proteinase inhibitor I2, Kunitz n=2 Tax=Neptuniibacter caesariensis TaxID=207954 RepID=A0A7U8C6W2_NEPCE|nr:proteinase inhibitor I2, Kunitz [Oceanospirillum sp. MED92] [Neptuniibacter caesariensis]
MCSDKPETGRCRAAFQKYFFNAEKQSCEMFIWGGCGGNVPFETKLECEKTCL